MTINLLCNEITKEEMELYFFKYCSEENVEEVRKSLEVGVDANFTEKESGRTGLIFTASGAVTKLLIDAGADVNIRCRYGFSAFTKPSNELEKIKHLIAANVDVNTANDIGKTPLMESQNPEIISLLLEEKADVNAKDNHGQTALMQHREPEIIKMLIDAGADVNATDEDGSTALMYALMAGVYVRMKIIADEKCSHRHQIVKTLVEAGADINYQRESDRKSALMMVKHLEDAMYLIEKGADITAIDFDQQLAHQQPHLHGASAMMIRSYLENVHLSQVAKTAVLSTNNQHTQPTNKRQRL